MNINPEEISSIIRKQIESFDVDLEMDEVGTVLMVGDGIARIHGLANVMTNEMIEFENGSIGLAMNQVRQGSVFLAFSNPPPGQKASLPGTSFFAKHVKPVWVHMDSNSFLHPVQHKRGGLSWTAGEQPVYRVYCHDDLARVFSGK